MISKLKSKLTALKLCTHHYIFAIFMLLQSVVIFAVPLFGDDYYYGSFLKKGLSYFITENVVHYTKTNGRAIVHLLDQFLLAGGTTILWKFFNLVSLGTAVYFTAAVASSRFSFAQTPTIEEKSRFSEMLIIICALSGLLEIGILRQTLYWATGSMNYLFPYALFIAYYYFLRRDVEKELASTSLWLLGFFTGFSSEQAGFAAFASTIVLMAMHYVKRRTAPLSQYFTNLVAVGAGFALQIFAPGNAMRTTYYPEFYAKSIFGRISENIKPLYNIIFNIDGIYVFVLIAFVSLMFYLATKAINSKKSVHKVLFYALSAGTLYTVCIYMHALINNRLILTELAFLPWLTVALLGFTVITVLKAKQEKNFEAVFFLILAPILQLAMLLSPQYGARTLLISAFCLFIPLASFIAEYVKHPVFAAAVAVILFAFTKADYPILLIFTVVAFGFYYIKKKDEKISSALAVLLICVSFSGVAKNAAGYIGNLPALSYNEKAVSAFKENSPEDKTLTLTYLPDPDYKYTMPYDDPYHLAWYKIINDLPDDTVIVFVNYDERP